MDQRDGAQTSLWIRDGDSLGNTIDPRLIETANRVWERARPLVIRYLPEDTDAPEILDAAVDSVSRAMSNGQTIQFFEPCLLTSVARQAIRRSKKNQRIAYMDDETLSESRLRYSRIWASNLWDPDLAFRACSCEAARQFWSIPAFQGFPNTRTGF